MTLSDVLFEFAADSDPYEPIKRIKTGLHSFDKAFEKSDGTYGMPIGTGYEVFGAKSTGKSTFCYSLMSIIGEMLQHNIILSDLEGFDPEHFRNILAYYQYGGVVKLIHQGTDEEILEEFASSMLRKDEEPIYHIGMLDSIAAISPIAEKNSDLGAANMGRRAFLVGQFSRRLMPTVHPRTVGSEHIYFMTNHWYEKIGTRGYQSPGGNVKDYLFGVQIHLGREYVSVGGKNSRSYPDGSYILNGTIYKNRYGKDRKTFKVFVKGGFGIHKGITAVLDAKDLGLTGSGRTIKLGDESYGYFKDIVENKWNDPEFFEPFYEVLKNVSDA